MQTEETLVLVLRLFLMGEKLVLQHLQPTEPEQVLLLEELEEQETKEHLLVGDQAKQLLQETENLNRAFLLLILDLLEELVQDFLEVEEAEDLLVLVLLDIKEDVDLEDLDLPFVELHLGQEVTDLLEEEMQMLDLLLEEAEEAEEKVPSTDVLVQELLEVQEL